VGTDVTAADHPAAAGPTAAKPGARSKGADAESAASDAPPANPAQRFWLADMGRLMSALMLPANAMQTPIPTSSAITEPRVTPRSLDRLLQAMLGRLTLGISPASVFNSSC
jgi:Poly-beta-hydroxybutyrate polymerase N terminal